MESSCGDRGGLGLGGCGGERCLAARAANLARAGVRPGGGWGSAPAPATRRRAASAMRRRASGVRLHDRAWRAAHDAKQPIVEPGSASSNAQPGTRLLLLEPAQVALGSTDAQRWRRNDLFQTGNDDPALAQLVVTRHASSVRKNAAWLAS